MSGKCRVCGNRTSMYNTSGKCWRHSADPKARSHPNVYSTGMVENITPGMIEWDLSLRDYILIATMTHPRTFPMGRGSL